MSEDLLQKVRALGGLLRDTAGPKLGLSALSRVLGQNTACHAYIVDNTGRILGHNWSGDSPCPVLRETVRKGAGFPASYAASLASVGETRANWPQQGRHCIFEPAASCRRSGILVTVVPVQRAGTRLGSVLLTRYGRSFTGADIVQAELAAAMAGAEVWRRRMDNLQNAQRRRNGMRVALAALTKGEIKALRCIMPNLLTGPGILVTSRMAQDKGCTRSVMVNALHKLKSAGLIELKSQGMKGTYVKLLVDNLDEEVARHRPGRG